MRHVLRLSPDLHQEPCLGPRAANTCLCLFASAICVSRVRICAAAGDRCVGGKEYAFVEEGKETVVFGG